MKEQSILTPINQVVVVLLVGSLLPSPLLVKMILVTPLSDHWDRSGGQHP